MIERNGALAARNQANNLHVPVLTFDGTQDANGVARPAQPFSSTFSSAARTSRARTLRVRVIGLACTLAWVAVVMFISMAVMASSKSAPAHSAAELNALGNVAMSSLVKRSVASLAGER